MTKNYRFGFTLLEMLIVSVLMGIILIPCVGMMSEMLRSQVYIASDIKTKQTKIDANQLILSRVREAAAYYYSGISLSLPINNNMVSVSPENNTLAVLIPKFDQYGNITQSSTNVTTFTGIAFSILPKGSTGYYQLWESESEFNIAVSPTDPLKIAQTLPSNWSNATSYLVADNLKPAAMTNMGSTAFDLERDMVTFSFVPTEGVIYFPSAQGSKTVDDSSYITSCELRNYRIQ